MSSSDTSDEESLPVPFDRFSEQSRPIATVTANERRDLTRSGSEPDLPDLPWPPRISSNADHTSLSDRLLFQRYSDNARHGTTSMSSTDMSPEARRQNIIAMDRKRRLTGSAQDSARRMNTPSGFHEREYTATSQHHSAASSSSSAPVPRPQPHSHRSGSSRHSAEIIDLTNSPPPSTPMSLPRNRPQQSVFSQSSVYVLPKWQPDNEVSQCPICRRQFSFLFRRHHCRKCGRVVCNDCSPHRITIPRQFIVNPPGLENQTSRGGTTTIDLTNDGEDEGDYPSIFSTSAQRHNQPVHSVIGGGEKVRLCNPCVPDPQPEPRPNFSSEVSRPGPDLARGSINHVQHYQHRSPRQPISPRGLTDPFPSILDQNFLPPAPGFSRPRTRTRVPGLTENVETGPLQLAPSLPYANDRHHSHGHHNRPRAPSESMIPGHGRYHSFDASRTQPHVPNRPRIRSMLDEAYVPRAMTTQGAVPRPRLNEEDICPVCRGVLPPRGSDGDETAREAHIVQCITLREPSIQTGGVRTTNNRRSPPRGPIHMLAFVATEKDCLGENGNSQECSICMVEYDVGDQLARLECLCKFHRECIVEWFGRKQECPVHKFA